MKKKEPQSWLAVTFHSGQWCGLDQEKETKQVCGSDCGREVQRMFSMCPLDKVTFLNYNSQNAPTLIGSGGFFQLWTWQEFPKIWDWH